jgi:DNA modification methylase
MSNLFTGDSLTILQSSAFTPYLKKVRTAIFSPPYYGKRIYGVDNEIGLLSNGISAYMEYLETMIHYIINEVLTIDGTLWINIKDSVSDSRYMGIPERLTWNLMREGIVKTGCAAWVCSNMGPSSNKRQFTEKWEPFYSFAGSNKYYFNLDPTREAPKYPDKRKQRQALLNGKGNVSGNPGAFLAVNPKGKNPGNAAVFWKEFEPSDMWCHPKANNHSSNNSATYPVELLRKPILASSDEGDLVLDPFCGEGSTLVQAVWLGRVPLGIDASPQSIANTEKRLQETVQVRDAYRKIAESDQKLI